MAFYARRPKVVEAFQWTDNVTKNPEWLTDAINRQVVRRNEPVAGHPRLSWWHGDSPEQVLPGGYIVRKKSERMRGYTPEEFHAKYQPV